VEENRRLKVLISAYACSPYRGSEPGVGWGFVCALARHHELWVIVEKDEFQEDIERELAINPTLKKYVRFFYVRRKHNPFLRKVWPPSYYWYYRRWHEAAYLLSRQLHKEVNFDLAHQLNMVGFREPGYLWNLDIPFVWGPVGGLGLFPWRFLLSIGGYGALYYLGYNLFNFLHMNFLSRPRKAAMRAGNGFLAVTRENLNIAKKYWGCGGEVLTEVGLPLDPVKNIRKRAIGEKLRLVWSGLHIHRKALNIGLRALNHIGNDIEWELNILGSGPLTESWKKLAVRLSIENQCHFHRWLERREALKIMENAHIILITSLRDLTASVTVEALALGLPIICLNHCGFSEVVDETCGLKIPVTTPGETVVNMSRAIEELARDEGKRRVLAEGALKRSRRYRWEVKVEAVNRIYDHKVRQCFAKI
jgi:glycosyltransferase involved in cell wall biosynthesis